MSAFVSKLNERKGKKSKRERLNDIYRERKRNGRKRERKLEKRRSLEEGGNRRHIGEASKRMSEASNGKIKKVNSTRDRRLREGGIEGREKTGRGRNGEPSKSE